MSSKLNQPWIPLERVDALVQLEPALFLLGLVLGTWLFSRVVLRHFSEKRQGSTRKLLSNLIYHLVLGTILFALFQILHPLASSRASIERIVSYLGLATIFSGATVFVKASRILAFEYFYLRHRKVAFPVLLVNLFTLLLSISLVGWVGTEIFNIRLTPILATSAIFSLVLGLALQDTLGNLFAGVTLQFDKPYEIGNWIEFHSDGQKWVGQVHEITWRATVLIALTEEVLIVPNRIMAQAKISNFSLKYRPIIRSEFFRLPFGVDTAKVKEILVTAASSIQKIRKIPPPKVWLNDTAESWIGFKLLYFIDNYGDQFGIKDEVYSKCLAALKTAGYQLASHKIAISQQEDLYQPHLPNRMFEE